MKYGNSIQDDLGKPDIELSSLQIWIHNRQFPDAKDYWDANWINVTIHCSALGSSILIQNQNIIHLNEILHFLRALEKLYTELNGMAELPCIEPNLYIKLESKGHGKIEMKVRVTPDHLYQRHEYIFDIDQNYLPILISECKEVLNKYPIKGKI